MFSIVYAAEEGLRDIRPIVKEPESLWLLWCCIFLFLFVSVLFFWWWRKRETKNKNEPIDFFETMLMQLNKTIKKDNVQEGYAQLSLILRRTLSHIYKIPVLEKTMPELINILETMSDLNSIWKSKLIDLCLRINETAYAPVQLDKKMMVEDVVLVENFIQEHKSKDEDTQLS